MDDLLERFEAVKKQKESLDRSKIEAETRLVTARDSQREVIAKLQDRFGVNSLERAKELFDRMSLEFEGSVAKLSGRMDALGIQQPVPADIDEYGL